MDDQLELNSTRISEIAECLKEDSIWVKRWYWCDENDQEFPEGHPNAYNHQFLIGIDYERIVRLVAGYLGVTSEEPPSDPNKTVYHH